MKFSIVVALQSSNKGIGYCGKLPWRYNKVDMEHFKNLTLNQTVIMGRLTFESLKMKPLKSRYNIVITSNKELISSEQLIFVDSIQKAFEEAKRIDKDIFIIGGAKLFDQVLKDYPQLLDKLYITQFLSDHTCDTFFNYDFTKHTLLTCKEYEDISISVYQ